MSRRSRRRKKWQDYDRGEFILAISGHVEIYVVQFITFTRLRFFSADSQIENVHAIARKRLAIRMNDDAK